MGTGRSGDALALGPGLGIALGRAADPAGPPDGPGPDAASLRSPPPPIPPPSVPPPPVPAGPGETAADNPLDSPDAWVNPLAEEEARSRRARCATAARPAAGLAAGTGRRADLG